MMLDANCSLLGYVLSLVLPLSLGNWEKGKIYCEEGPFPTASLLL